MRIAELIGQTIQPPCIMQQVAYKPGTMDYDCTVTSHSKDSLGTVKDTSLPACGGPANQGPPCWQLVDGGGAGGTCAGGKIVDPMMLMDPNATMGGSQNATVNCSLCDPMHPDATRGCN